MNFTAHFHTNYTSSGVGATYTKVSVEIDGFGMFCVIRNKNTGMIQRQAYMSGKYTMRHYIGLSHKGYFDGVDSLKRAWSRIDDADKNYILGCVKYSLTSSFRQFSKKYQEISGMPSPEENEVYTYLNNLRQALDEMSRYSFSTSASSDSADSTAVVGATTANWDIVKINELSTQDLQNIIAIINDNGNPEEGIEYKGNRYCVICDDDGRRIIRVIRGNANCESVNGFVNDNEKQPKPVAPPKPKRRTKRMALMMNNESFTEFVNGCYYQFVKECGGGYIKILNDANEERTVSKSRVSIIDVYDQPPFEEVTA